MNEQIHKLLDGKLGNLAKEIADETAKDLDINLENVDSVNGVFKELFKNPGKLMNLVKNVGDKLSLMSSAFISTPLGSIPKQEDFKIAGIFNTGFIRWFEKAWPTTF